jgi:hypothetical protein
VTAMADDDTRAYDFDSDADDRAQVAQMLLDARRNRLPKLLVARDRVLTRAASGGEVDAAALVRLEELCAAAEQEFYAQSPEHRPSAGGENGIDRLYRECREHYLQQPGPHGPAASPEHVESCSHPACKEEVVRALEIAERCIRASALEEERREVAARIRAEEAARPQQHPQPANAVLEATPHSGEASYAPPNVVELPRPVHAGLVLITEMVAPYMGAAPRPVERWVSREEHDKIERLRRLGELPPQPSGPPPTPREQYERDMMDAAHRDAAGDGLYGNFVASYERGDP